MMKIGRPIPCRPFPARRRRSEPFKQAPTRNIFDVAAFYLLMSLDAISPEAAPLRRPQRVQRTLGTKANSDVIDVGPGTKGANPIKKQDVDALISSEPDIAAAVQARGWKAGAVILYRDHLLEANLDPTELQGKDLSCTCKLTDPCHADLLIELANA